MTDPSKVKKTLTKKPSNKEKEEAIRLLENRGIFGLFIFICYIIAAICGIVSALNCDPVKRAHDFGPVLGYISLFPIHSIVFILYFKYFVESLHNNKKYGLKFSKWNLFMLIAFPSPLYTVGLYALFVH